MANGILEIPISTGPTANIDERGDGTARLKEQLNDSANVKLLAMGIDGVLKDYSDSAQVLSGARALPDGGGIDFNRQTNDFASGSLHSPHSVDLNLSTGDFVAEGVIVVDSFPPANDIVNMGGQIRNSRGVSAQVDWALIFQSGTLFFISTLAVGNKSVAFAFSAATEYHVRVARTGNDLRFWVDGDLKSTQDITGANYSGNSRDLFMGLYLSGAIGANIDFLDGQIKWFRVTKGDGRETGNFTPPTIFNSGSSTSSAFAIAPISTEVEMENLEIEVLDTANTSVLFTWFKNGSAVAEQTDVTFAAMVIAGNNFTSTDADALRITAKLITTEDGETPIIVVRGQVPVTIPAGGASQADIGDVRLGTVYADGALTGTLAVPPKGDVEQGVATDDGVGTYVQAPEAQVALGFQYGEDGTEFTGESVRSFVGEIEVVEINTTVELVEV